MIYVGLFFLILSIMIIIVGSYVKKSITKKIWTNRTTLIDKEKSLKLKIKSAKCTIKSSSSVKKIKRITNQFSWLEPTFGNNEVKPEMGTQSMVVYKDLVDGKEKTFVSPTMNMDKDTLMFLIQNEKGFLYYHRETGNYLFEFSF